MDGPHLARVDFNLANGIRSDLGPERHPLPSNGNGGFLLVLITVVVGGGAYKLIAWLVDATPRAYAEKSSLNFVLAIMGTFVLAGFFYYLREHKRRWWFLYPAIELGVSAALSATAVGQQQHEPWISVIALLSAVRVAVDGINRLVVFHTEARRSISQEERQA